MIGPTAGGGVPPFAKISQSNPSLCEIEYQKDRKVTLVFPKKKKPFQGLKGPMGTVAAKIYLMLLELSRLQTSEIDDPLIFKEQFSRNSKCQKLHRDLIRILKGSRNTQTLAHQTIHLNPPKKKRVKRKLVEDLVQDLASSFLR